MDWSLVRQKYMHLLSFFNARWRAALVRFRTKTRVDWRNYNLGHVIIIQSFNYFDSSLNFLFIHLYLNCTCELTSVSKFQRLRNTSGNSLPTGHTFWFVMETFRAESQRVGSRMLISGALGAIGGAARAMYTGNPLIRAAILTGTSCCLVGTSCFGCESLAYFAIQRFNQSTGAEVAHGRDLLRSEERRVGKEC